TIKEAAYWNAHDAALARLAVEQQRALANGDAERAAELEAAASELARQAGRQALDPILRAQGLQETLEKEWAGRREIDQLGTDAGKYRPGKEKIVGFVNESFEDPEIRARSNLEALARLSETPINFRG